jgi:hypothetical protein
VQKKSWQRKEKQKEMKQNTDVLNLYW